MAQDGANCQGGVSAAFRPGGRARPRRRRRQALMGALFLLLAGIIWGYWIVTDSERVRDMAEQYLSDIVGGRVEVKKASLSLFEGLRLDGVSVYIDEHQRPDSCIFTARTFLLKVSPRALLAGRVQATQIVALGPQVNLCEDLDTGQWNFRRLQRRRPALQRSPRGAMKPDLPEILLRAGVVQYSRIVRGEHRQIGILSIDGNLSPLLPPGRGLYSFDLESRAPRQPAGPHVLGQLDLDTRSLTAELTDVEFDQTVRAMLPSQVQQWWDAHQVSGRIRVPRFAYAPGTHEGAFEITVELEDVSLVVFPEDLGEGDWPRLPMAAALSQHPLRLTNAAGRIVFAPDGVRIAGIGGQFEGNHFLVSGAVRGYNPGAATDVRVVARNVQIPRMPRYLPILPYVIGKEYGKFLPMGRMDLAAEITHRPPSLGRRSKSGRVFARATMDVLNGAFAYEGFRYPLREVTGRIVIDSREDVVWIENVRGCGILGSANEKTPVDVSGWVRPMSRDSEVRVDVVAKNVHLDNALRAAVPREAREAIALFDCRPDPDHPGTTRPLQMRGDIAAVVKLVRTPAKKLTVDVGLDIAEASGAYEKFAYPIDALKGRMDIYSDHLEVVGVTGRQGSADLAIDGVVRWGKDRPVAPELKVRVKNAPVDAHLRGALPEDYAAWMVEQDTRGIIDVDGRIYLNERTNPEDPSVDIDLDIALHKGAIMPVLQTHALTDIEADLNVTLSRLVVRSAEGKRGDAKVTGAARVDWAGERPFYALRLEGKNVLADRALYEACPKSAQRWWDVLRPEGRGDVDFAYEGVIAEESDGATEGRAAGALTGGIERSSTAGAEEAPDVHPGLRGETGLVTIRSAGEDTGGTSNQQPATNNSTGNWQLATGNSPPTTDHYTVRIVPRGMALTPVRFPWRMEGIEGQVDIVDDNVTLTNLTARHEKALLGLSGRSTDDGWTLALTGKDIAIDRTFREALPGRAATMFKDSKVGGVIQQLDCPRLTIIEPAEEGGAREVRAEGRVSIAGGAMESVAPLSGLEGSADFMVLVKDGRLHRLLADVKASTLTMAGRELRNLSCRMARLPGSDVLQLRNFQAKLASGALAGQADLRVPEKGPSRYAFSAVIKDVDVGQFVGNGDAQIKGLLSASLAMEGDLSDTKNRRGRGDVRLQGKELYRIPVVFGLLQIANLTLPIKSPFTEATTRYTVEGEKVILERIELRAANMLMEGNGTIGFDSRKVAMTFTTYNPDWPSIPVIGPLLEGARKELLQINVTGRVEQPKVSARTFSTFSTTVDQVFTPAKRSPGRTRPKERP